jgi:hypothetical protein
VTTGRDQSSEQERSVTAKTATRVNSTTHSEHRLSTANAAGRQDIASRGRCNHGAQQTSTQAHAARDRKETQRQRDRETERQRDRETERTQTETGCVPRA